jgi:multicomponent Na+:H+ antiporter subunit E
MSLSVLILALPIGLFWITLSREATWQVFVVGYVLGVIVLYSLRRSKAIELQPAPATARKAPLHLRVWELLSYTVRLLVNILASGIDVGWRVLQPNIETAIKPGFIRIPTHDDTNNSNVSALSAHSITITPGSLAVEFEERDGKTHMLVHVLDTNMYNEQTLNDDQTVRAKQIKRILGG